MTAVEGKILRKGKLSDESRKRHYGKVTKRSRIRTWRWRAGWWWFIECSSCSHKLQFLAFSARVRICFLRIL